MRLPAVLLIAACALAAGCTSLASRTRERDRDRNDRPIDRPRDERPWWQNEPGLAARDKSRPLPPTTRGMDREGIIAGVVVDAREGLPLKGITFVRVRAADDASPASGTSGLEFETDADGYFFVPGLTPGKTYILSVVREVNGRKIAGEAQVKPPSGNIRLELDESKVSSTTPPLPPPPSMGPFENGVDPAVVRPPTPGGASGDRGWEPAAAGPSNNLPRIDLPPPPLDKENIAGNPMLPPTAAIRPPPPAAPSGPSRRLDEEPSPVRTDAQRIPNFRVSTLTGGDWEFRYADGQLILMEFWSTTCAPCQRAMPAIKRLQTDYGRSGLEIVAVACEADSPFYLRARDVESVARRKELNYKVYLERDGRVGEIQKLFNVKYLPTLVLLDRRGTIMWEGGVSEDEFAKLDDIIRTYLTRR